MTVGFISKEQWVTRKPWLPVNSVALWKEWAKAVVPPEFAYRMSMVIETDYNIEPIEIANWTYDMRFIASHDVSREWIYRFASLKPGWARTPRNRKAFLNSVKLVCFAIQSLVHDDIVDFPIPSYKKEDLDQAEELRSKISEEDTLEVFASLILADKFLANKKASVA